MQWLLIFFVTTGSSFFCFAKKFLFFFKNLEIFIFFRRSPHRKDSQKGVR